jgi:diaminopimelate epimerase
MADVNNIRESDLGYVLDTGSPHLVRFVPDPGMTDVEAEGRAIRNSSEFRREGINVNFVSAANNTLKIRTYERGVEAETLSCGTGAVAAAVAAATRQGKAGGRVQYMLETKGGHVEVEFEISPSARYTSIKLSGPAEFVFSGSWPQ